MSCWLRSRGRSVAKWDVWVMGEYEWHQMNPEPFKTRMEARSWAQKKLASNHHYRIEKRPESPKVASTTEGES